MSRLSHSCLVLNLFTPDKEEQGKKKKRHLLCTHPTPSMENGTGCNESQQWSLMEQQILMSFQFLRGSPGDEKPAVHYQTGSCFL